MGESIEKQKILEIKEPELDINQLWFTILYYILMVFSTLYKIIFSLVLGIFYHIFY